MFEFEKLEAFKKSKVFYKQILELLNTHSFKDQILKDQFKRAALSIVLNIAEGAGRFHRRDKKNFYVNSRASVNECVAILQLLLDDECIEPEQYKKLYSSLEELGKIISGLVNSQK